MTPITYEDWAAALESASEVASDGETIRGWSERLGISLEKTEKWIDAGMSNGWVERVKIARHTRIGTTATRIGFRVVKKDGA